MKEITGKKRTVVDDDIFMDLDRTSDGQFSSATNFLGASYIPSAANKDTLRAALGKNWDYDFPESQQAIAGGTKIFKNDNTKLNIFCDTPLSIDYCSEPEVITPGSSGPLTEWGGHGIRQHIVLECNVSEEKFQNTFSSNAYFNPDDHTPGGLNDGFGDTIFWAFLMQYGVVTPSNQTLMPLVKTYSHQDTSINGIEFFDHYHEAIAPYTPSELANQETAGKAFYVDYETYYNSRISTPGVGSQGYEDFIGSVSDYQNCLPNIYGFTKIAESNNFAEDGFFNIDKIVKGPNPFANDITFIKYYQQFMGWWKGSTEEGGYANWILLNDAYIKLFKYYPLEVSALLYGSMAGLDRRERSTTDLYDNKITITPAEIALPENPTIQQLLKLDAKTTDTTSLFARWFENFKRVLSEDTNFAVRKMNSPNWPDERGPAPSTKLGGLEYINSNLAFSHNAAVSLLNKADQYKKHFPMYFELNFTAKQATQLGDSIKNLKMGKFFSSLAATQHPTRLVPGGYYQKEYLNPDQSLPFVDFVETNVYKTLFDPADPGSGKAVFITIPAMDAPAWVANDKMSIDLFGRLNAFADGNDYSSVVMHPPPSVVSPEGSSLAGLQPGDESTLTPAYIFQYNETASNGYEHLDFPIGIAYPGPLFRHDLRNHMAYIRNDADEPPSQDPDCNALFKALGATAFRQRLIEIYNEKRRTYQDILEGVPAYTEDLFYVITKFRKDINSSEEEVVQNIIIPNTSDLNIVNYIDTQVKYGAHATYRYEVFAHRVVFGSRYRYKFRTSYQKAYDPNGGIGLVDLSNAAQSDYTQYPLQLIQEHGETGYVDGVGYTANYNVEVYPSIKIIVDKIFSTPEVKILDRPPVAPDVNVVPYRAVNDKIRIMLCGQTDKYREEPVIILDEDEQSFKQLMESQFSHDKKVEFSSDDRIAGFEVFRIEDRPSSYSDFLLHPDSDIAIVDGFSVAFDDDILPNKKYYYTFRARDAHGHVSNPSAVYEIELIDEKGAVKPLIRTISMEKKENKISTKECQKYILLRPTHNQLHFSSDNNPDINSVFTTDQTSGKKKYKMRLTSKGTGKKIDINFSFFKDFSED